MESGEKAQTLGGIMQGRVTACGIAIAVFAAMLVPAPVSAAIISETYVESRSGGQIFGDYTELSAFPDGWASSSAKSTAPGTTAGIGSRFNSNTDGNFGGAFEVSPTLPTAGGTYEVYATITGASGAITANTGVTVTGGSGLPSETTAFSTPGNVWNLIGTLVLDPGVSEPTIRFNEITHTNRFYADAIRFAEVDPIPEPASLGLLGIATAGFLARRRRA